MAAAPISVRTVLLEQADRTSGSPKANIQMFIAESQFKIASLESQILAEESQTGVLIKLRQRERVIVAVLQHLIAPIHTLPVELLAEIFVFAIRIITDDYLRRSLHIKDAFRISHVCVDWRQIANSTPRLWAGPISINFNSGRLDNDVFANGLRSWLGRSAPLAVPVSLGNLRDGIGFDVSPRITDEVLAISPRWRSLQVGVPAPASFIRWLAEGSLDSLEELHLGKIALDVPDLDLASLLSFSTGAGRLRKLSIYVPCPLPMPWTQLTDLTLANGGSPDILFDILPRCPNLVTVAIVTAGWLVIPPSRLHTLTLNHLRILSLKFTYGTEVHAMQCLDPLSAPILEELCLHSALNFIQWTEARFSAFQLRSPNITRLSLSRSHLTSADLSAALSHAPRLMHLSLSACPHCIDDALLHALSYKDDAESLAPSLHSLVLYEIDENAYTEDVLAGMIASRWWTDIEMASRSVPPAVARWTHVELEKDFFGQPFVDTMEDLKNKDLNVGFF